MTCEICDGTKQIKINDKDASSGCFACSEVCPNCKKLQEGIPIDDRFCMFCKLPMSLDPNQTVIAIKLLGEVLDCLKSGDFSVVNLSGRRAGDKLIEFRVLLTGDIIEEAYLAAKEASEIN